MSDYSITMVYALTIAGSTFAFGFVFGWFWALFHFSGFSDHSNQSDKED
jgi:hypothetical protein